MSDIKQRLTTALLREGQEKLANFWKVDQTTVGRRLNDNSGMKLSEFADALDFLGIKILTPDEQLETIPTDELHALRTLAKKGLDVDAD